MKKWIFWIIGIIILLAAGGSWLYIEEHRPVQAITAAEKPEIWVISDPHFIDPALHDQGKAFKYIEATAAGKDLTYQSVSLHALVQTALIKKPQAIVITGDLTLNGEKQSAQRLMRIFHPLFAKHIPVLVTPGNHDIFDGWARRFVKNNEYTTDQISPSDFKKIFAQDYQYAQSSDKDSLSYAVKLNQHYLLLLVDDDTYGQVPSSAAPNVGGRLQPESLNWINQQLKNARRKNLTPIIFMHHNLYAHSRRVTTGYVLDNANQLKKLTKKYQVPVLFSGHIHAQDISRDPQKKNPTIEVVSGSFATSPLAYGKVILAPQTITYQRENLNITSFLTPAEKKNHDLTHFQTYLKKLFVNDSGMKAFDALYGNGLKNQKALDSAIDAFGEANWRYFSGHDDLSDRQVQQLEQTRRYKLLKKYAPSMYQYSIQALQDHNLNDQHLVIKLHHYRQ